MSTTTISSVTERVSDVLSSGLSSGAGALQDVASLAVEQFESLPDRVADLTGSKRSSSSRSRGCSPPLSSSPSSVSAGGCAGVAVRIRPSTSAARMAPTRCGHTPIVLSPPPLVSDVAAIRRISSKLRRNRRETCICEIPTRAAISL